MKQINLLPLEYQNQAKVGRTGSLLALSALVLFLILAGSWVMLGGVASDLQARVESVRAGAEAQRASQANSEIAQAEAALAQRISILNQLAVSEVNWSAVFDTFNGLVSKDIRIDSFESSVLENTVTLKIGGRAPSNTTFVEFREYLRQPDFQSVSVDGYTYQPTDGSVVFLITITIPRSDVRYQIP